MAKGAGGGAKGEWGKPGVRAIAERIRGARKRARLTQVELAKRLGRSQTFVSQAETDQARVGERLCSAGVGRVQLAQELGGAEAEEADRVGARAARDCGARPRDAVAGQDWEPARPGAGAEAGVVEQPPVLGGAGSSLR
jgi:DNA-binding XRE family transcriptional regulator